MSQDLNVADLAISSSAFSPNGAIGSRYTSDGDDVSPDLEWTGAPDGTKAFALVVHDPDAPLVDGFTHWVAYGISGDVSGLPEAADPPVQGKNSLGNARYNGPAPPDGHGVHHYYFWVYALDEDLDLEAGLERPELLALIEDHVIEQARVIGTYER